MLQKLEQMRFEKIKQHLSRKRTDRVEIEYESENYLQFTVKGKWFEKYFAIHYRDGFSKEDSLTMERQRGYHYYMQFSQPDYPQNGNLVEISDWSWYQTEEDIIEQIKRFCRNWRA